jgi:8-oxo-dGTP diphosphatase
MEELPRMLYYLLLVPLALTLFGRNQGVTADGKRKGYLAWALLVLVANAVLVAFLRFEVPLAWLYPLGAVALLGVLRWRRLFLPWRLRCKDCGAHLSTTRVLYRDDNRCDSCRPQPIPRRVEDVDWENWQFSEHAVLCFIRRGDDVVLIHKKTGLGAGKINGPGGRIEEGETATEAAIRECQEEIGLTPIDPEKVADLSFIFTDGYSLHGSAFLAHDFEGEMVETDEAKPFWQNIDSLPLDQMWADDPLWLPDALEGVKKAGRFIFSNDTMVDDAVVTVESFT